jgi:hypothetical protein
MPVVVSEDSARIPTGRRLSRKSVARSAYFFIRAAGFCLIAAISIFAQQAPTEYQVKAAYLFNFLKFVEWPEDLPAGPESHWVIGIVGNGPMDGELTQLVAGKIVQGHTIQVKVFQPNDDFKGCHILYIGASEKKRLAPILANMHNTSILTVADMDNFVESGGMIQFVMEDNRVKVTIDVGATLRAKLKVSSKLLSLARVVTSAEKGTNN